MAIPLTKGNTSIRERPDSPEWDYNTQKVTCTRTFEGMYADLLSSMPDIGYNMEGYNPNLLIENVKIKKAVSGKATMTIVLETLVDPITNPPAPVQPVYEIEWTQIERPIEQHPFFKLLFPDPFGVLPPLNATQVNALNAFRLWETSADNASAASTNYANLTKGFQALAQKKMRGETSYLIFAPVARITTLTREVVLASACGFVFTDVPGFTELPAGYQWLQTADRSTRTGTYGKWQRVQEWTGAIVWDSNLYPAQGSAAPPGDGTTDGSGTTPGGPPGS
jgi:hypothetical protein